MPHINVITESFPKNNQWAVGNCSREFDVSIPELLHAAITVGHPNYSVVLGGGQIAAAYEMMWKVASTMMTLREYGGSFSTSFFTPTGRFENLDPSEKRGATYQLGLTINKLVALRLFGVQWLVHLDVYASRLSPVIHSGRSRPDLVGQDNHGHYFVFESKGRVSPPSAKDKQKAKDQASRIISISGAAPVLAASCMAYFRKESKKTRKHLECYVEDPPMGEIEGDNLEKHELNIGDYELIRDYYRPLIPLFNDRNISQDSGFLFWRSRAFDLELQLDPKVHNFWQNEEYKAIRNYLVETKPKKRDNGYQVNDGIRIIPGERWLELGKNGSNYE